MYAPPESAEAIPIGGKVVKKLLLGSTVVLGMMQAAIVSAEVVTMPVGAQAKHKQQVSRPLNGMTRAQVEAKYGTPRTARGPVGEPPISAWEYADYVVYFEYDLVLHTVLKHQRQAQ